MHFTSVIFISLLISTLLLLSPQRVSSQTAANNVMQVKLLQAMRALSAKAPHPAVAMSAIQEGFDALFTSSLAILPSGMMDQAGGAVRVNPDADKFSTMHAKMMSDFTDTLTRYILAHLEEGAVSAEAVSAAIEARNLLELTREAMGMIGQQTKNCAFDQNKGQLVGVKEGDCDLLQQEDDGGIVLDPSRESDGRITKKTEPEATSSSNDSMLGDHSRRALGVVPLIPHILFEREVRFPNFPPWIWNRPLDIKSHGVQFPALAPGECSVHLQKYQGIKVVVRVRYIPIWVEPWYARATIIGWQPVWTWEWIPAEYIKHINICNVNGAISSNIKSEMILDTPLTHFWKLFDPPCC